MGEEEKNYSAGNVHISEDVIVSIISLAVAEVDGVAITQASPMEFAERLTRKGIGRGVKVVLEGNEVSADVFIHVEYGLNIPQKALHIQQKIKSAVESMTNLAVRTVHVTVTSVAEKKEKKGE